MNLDAVRLIFFEESEELLAAMEAALLAVEAATGPEQAEHLNAMFRAAHTIKGSAGLFEMHGIVAFTHRCESLLDRMRSGELEITSELVELLFACRDHMSGMIEAERLGHPMPSALTLDAQLDDFLQPVELSSPPLPIVQPEETVKVEFDGEHVAASDHWHISLRFGVDVLRNGMDPISFLRYLSALGRIVYITTLYDGLPEPDEMDPESCYLGFEIQFSAGPGVDKLTIENVFEFVREDSKVRILPPHAHLAEFVRLIKDLPEGASLLGETLVRGGALTPKELEEVLAIQRE